MNNERSIAPGLRKGEVLPESPEGMTVTRFHGEFVFVPKATDEDVYNGKSPYTQRQLEALSEMERERMEKARQALAEIQYGIYMS